MLVEVISGLAQLSQTKVLENSVGKREMSIIVNQMAGDRPLLRQEGDRSPLDTVLVRCQNPWPHTAEIRVAYDFLIGFGQSVVCVVPH